MGYESLVCIINFDGMNNIRNRTKYFLLTISFMILYFSSKATTWRTISNGNWNDSFVWANNIVPQYTLSDTILIKDSIRFQDNIILNSGSYLEIDSSGGLCGHYNITVPTGSKLISYGAFEVDTFYIPGGNVIMYVTNFLGASRIELTVSGASMNVYSNQLFCICPWDTCYGVFTLPKLDSSITIKNSFQIYPIPSNGNFSIKYSQINETIFMFYDLLGQEINSTKLFGNSGIQTFSFPNLSDGIYYWKIFSGIDILDKGKIVIIK